MSSNVRRQYHNSSVVKMLLWIFLRIGSQQFSKPFQRRYMDCSILSVVTMRAEQSIYSSLCAVVWMYCLRGQYQVFSLWFADVSSFFSYSPFSVLNFWQQICKWDKKCRRTLMLKKTPKLFKYLKSHSHEISHVFMIFSSIDMSENAQLSRGVYKFFIANISKRFIWFWKQRVYNRLLLHPCFVGLSLSSQRDSHPPVTAAKPALISNLGIS